MSTKSKKRGYGGDGNYVETGYAVTVTAIGTSHDENRHVARWKDQLGERLEAIGGPLLREHVVSDMKEPRKMTAPPEASIRDNYLDTNTDVHVAGGGSAGDASGAGADESENAEELEKQHAKYQRRLYKLIEKMRKLHDDTPKRPPAGHQASVYAKYHKDADVHRAKADSMWIRICKCKSKLQNGKGSGGGDGGGALDSGESDAGAGHDQLLRDNEFYQLVVKTCGSKVASGDSPLTQRPEAFKAFASKQHQQALHVEREKSAKRHIIATTVDSLEAQCRSMKDTKSAYELMQHVISTWRPVEEEDFTKTINAFCACIINQSGTQGLDEGQTYSDFIQKFNVTELNTQLLTGPSRRCSRARITPRTRA